MSGHDLTTGEHSPACPHGCILAPVTTPLPTPAEVEEMRERHGNHGDGRCTSGEYWPCDAARLLALMDLHAAVASANRGLEAIRRATGY